MARASKSPLETAALVHAGVFVIASSWCFGGNIWWAELPLKILGSFSLPIFLTGLFHFWSDKKRRNRMAQLLLPLLLLNALTLLGLFNTNHQLVSFGGTQLLAKGGDTPWLPSVAVPLESLKALWWFDTFILTGLNLFFLTEHRQRLRNFFLLLASNALVLAVLGTLQSFLGFTGPYFGLVHPPGYYFFATFIYHNHWSTFVLLCLGASLGLAWHFYRKAGGRYRDFWHSPSTLALVLILFLAASIPLSASRSCTVLALLFLGGALVHWTRHILKERRASGRRVAPVLASAMLACSLGLVGIIWAAKPAIERRYEGTVSEIQTKIVGGPRAVIYRDVWTMFSERPIFGWGRGSFQHAFYSFNSIDRIYRKNDRTIFKDAHSDWLQSLAENGIVGTGLILLLAALPLVYSFRHLRTSILSRYLLAGACFIVLQAAWEFPFGCPCVALLWWICWFAAARYPTLES